MANKRLALTKDGRMTWCTADEENIGKGRCNHVAHQKVGETQEEFMERANKLLSNDSNGGKNMKANQNKIYSNESEILNKINECLENTGSYSIINEGSYAVMVSKKALDNLKLANILPENFDYNQFLIDCNCDLEFEGVEDYGFEENWANEAIKENIKNNQMYRLYSENSGSILSYMDEILENVDGNYAINGNLLYKMSLEPYGPFNPFDLKVDGALYTQIKS